MKQKPTATTKPSAPTKAHGSHMKNLKHPTGEVAPHRIPIYDHKGNMRGHVGRTATGATVARFLGRHGAKLGEKDGRDAWIGDRPPPPKYPGISASGKPIPGLLPDGTPAPLPGMGPDGKPSKDPASDKAGDKPKPTKHALDIYFKTKK